MKNLTQLLVLLLAVLTGKSAQEDVSAIVQKRVRNLISSIVTGWSKCSSIFKRNHKPLDIAPHNFAKLAEATNLDHFNEALANILVPRVVGTETHEQVKDYIVESFRKLNWEVELDEFDEDTPLFKNLHFSNIIATLNPKAERFLVLACHYDSKYFPNEEFLGATDSAVPCAMLLNLAHVMSKYFEQIKHKTDVSIKLVMFDGEEAFKTWTATDSVSFMERKAEAVNLNA